MSTQTQIPPDVASSQRKRERDAHDLWVSLAIITMWLAVLLDALFGPDIDVTDVTTHSTVPSAVVLAFFAAIATCFVAWFGWRRGHDR